MTNQFPFECVKDLREKADIWISENPRFYELFKQYAAKLYDADQPFSIKLIAERVRWEVRIEWRGEFKISNDIVAYIGRRLAEDMPELNKVFKFRQTKW